MKTKNTSVSTAQAAIIGKKIGMTLAEFGKITAEAVRVFRESRTVFDEFKKVKPIDLPKSKFHK